MLTPSRLSIGLALLALGLAGCPWSNAPPQPGLTATESPLKLVVVDDPELGKAISREWLARTEQELKLLDVTAQEIAEASRLPGDVVIFPSGLIGQFAERELIVPLSDATINQSEFDRRDIFDQVRLREMVWGNHTLAVPLGSPQLLLAYRPDIFEKLGLSPPKDWDEYQTLVEKLSDREALGDLAPPADQPWRATIEPLADGWAGQVLMARAAPLVMHRDQVSPLFEFDTATPLIDKQPYALALEQLAAAAKSGGFADQKLSPTEAVAEVQAGRAAMAIGWAGTKAAVGETTTDAQPHKIAFALLPGAPRAFNFATGKWDERGADEEARVATLAVAGRMGAITSSSASTKRGAALLAWLAGSEASAAIGPTSAATTLFRQSHLANPGRWTAGLSAGESQQYAQTLAAAVALPQAFPGMRVPGRDDYLRVLDVAVWQAVAGEKSPADALRDAAAAWSAVTERIGDDVQQRAILHSIGEGSLP